MWDYTSINSIYKYEIFNVYIHFLVSYTTLRTYNYFFSLACIDLSHSKWQGQACTFWIIKSQDPREIYVPARS